MRRGMLLLIAGIVCIGVTLAALHPFAPEEPSLSRFAPSGAMLFLEAKDFSAILADWNASEQKRQWLKSGNYRVFSESRLFLRLKEASDQFAAAAGLPPDMEFVGQVAGTQSALALYDIGKLQFLYVAKISAADSARTMLWKTRTKFETRSASGVTFYLRRDPQSEREVAFAINGDYLLLATREDLMAGALQLMAGSKDQTIQSEAWWSRSVAASGEAGDLRMVLNLEKIVPSPYFRSYWIQRNITDMKQYSAAVSDLFLMGKQYREERVLVKKTNSAEGTNEGSAAVADLAKLIPAEASFYEVRANPSVEESVALLETKILAPHMGPGMASRYAPQVQLGSGETGSGGDLETRIDQPPLETHAGKTETAALKNMLETNPIRTSLQVQYSEVDKGGVFVRFHSGIVLLGDGDWNESLVRSAVAEFVRPALTASQLGVAWRTKQEYMVLDGLWPLSLAVRGKYLIVSDDHTATASLLTKLGEKSTEKPALFVAGFNHAREGKRFRRLANLLDNQNPGELHALGHAPQFFSENVASLSAALAGVSSEKVVVRDAGDKVLQTVTYEWGQ